MNYDFLYLNCYFYIITKRALDIKILLPGWLRLAVELPKLIFI